MSNDGFLRSVPSDADQDDGRLYDPTAPDAGGSVNLTNVGGIASEEAFGAATVAPTVSTVGIESSEAIGTATVVPVVSAAGIASAEAIGTAVTVPVAATTGIPTAEALGTLTLSPTAGVTGIASEESLGTSTLSPVAALTGIASGEALGAVTLGAEIGTVGIASEEALGTPVLTVEVSVEGVPSSEGVGTPTLTLADEARSVPWVWNPHQESDEERAERVLRAHIRLGIVAPPADPAVPQEPAQAGRAVDAESRRVEGRDSPLAPWVPPPPAVEAPAAARTEYELSPEQLEELRLLMEKAMQRRSRNAALAAILLSAAMH